MKAIGTIEITEELTLENPTLEFNNVYVECIFVGEDGLRNSRLMKVDLSSIDLEAAKQSNEVLKQFI